MRDKLLNILLGVLIVTIIGVSIYAIFFNNEILCSKQSKTPKTSFSNESTYSISIFFKL